MTNCIFYTVIFVLFLNFTFGSLRYSQVNRTFQNLYKGVFEASTITIDEKGEPVVPYYDKETLEVYLTDYFKKSLNQYVTDYQVKVYYFDRKTDQLCFFDKCRDVNVTLKAKINTFFTYEKSRNFSVFDRNEL